MPRLLQLLDALDRQEGDAALVALLLGEETAGINAVGHAAQPVELPAAGRALQRPAAVMPAAALILVIGVVSIDASLARLARRGDDLVEKARQLVRFHLEKLNVHLGHVHRDHGQAAVLLLRQHHAAAGEVEGWRDRGGLYRVARLGREGSAVFRLHAGHDAHDVARLGFDVREVQQARILPQHPGTRYRGTALGLGVLGPRAYSRTRFRARLAFVVFVRLRLGLGLSLFRHGVPGTVRHLEHLDALVEIAARIQRQAERQRQRRRAIERALGRIHQREYRGPTRRQALALQPPVPGTAGHKDNEKQENT